MKEIRAQPGRREFHDHFTGMRDFAGAVQELDEVWRGIFATGHVASASRR
jgi:hypothetical protein